MSILCQKRTFSVRKARKAQIRLAKKLILEDRLPSKIRLVAGVDVAYAKNLSIGAVAVVNYDSLELIESQIAVCETQIPYIPTVLSFREIHPSVMSIRKLKTQPDLFLVDGQGYAHPYRCGFASHLGLVIRKPTIGAAKSRLLGETVNAPTEENIPFLKHKNEIIGAAVSTSHGSKPVYVSTGHMVSLDTAIEIIKHCTQKNRIPEPLLKAHEIATEEKRKRQYSISEKRKERETSCYTQTK